ncbi:MULTISPECIES: tetraether lipid synthase Tes, partial [unclassified Archaeoglobus]|uniref:tetraether lipid synthase Tes n=1 Tax=unclassified Archaeoglobus TaxID=2643606 RepID=UPI0025BE7552
LTGGEPTLRDDLVEIIRMIKEEGYDHIQLNTNGVRLAEEEDFALKVRVAGVNTVYLSFDGVDERTNPKNHHEVPKVLENCRRAQLGIVLVPTVIKSVNDHQLGDIVRFAADNIDIIRGVNFQPVSLVGSMPKREREQFRITIPDCIKAIEEQTGGEIGREDFYPVPSVTPISRFIEALTGNPQYELTTHFACGMATYVFKDNGRLIPITRFVDVEGLFEFLNEKAEEITNSRMKTVKALKNVVDLRKFIDSSKAPRGFNVSKILFDVLVKHDYTTLGQFHLKSLFIGMMHFQDLYNYDISRVERCEIHYGSPDGRIIPFCSFNVIPEKYRDAIHEKYGIPIEEWEKKSGRKLKDDIKRVVRRPR